MAQTLSRSAGLWLAGSPLGAILDIDNPDVVLRSSSFSQAGTEVIVGVGPQRARWRCIADSDGTTAGIQSLTDEGAL